MQLRMDNVEKKSASLLSDTDFKPPINPPKEIDDPNDAKPADWVDDPKMDEPGAAKPDDWDEDAPKLIDDPKASKPSTWLDDAPEMIPDPKSEMPSDWDADEDGEWEAPLIKNPDCAKAGCGAASSQDPLRTPPRGEHAAHLPLARGPLRAHGRAAGLPALREPGPRGPPLARRGLARRLGAVPRAPGTRCELPV